MKLPLNETNLATALRKAQELRNGSRVGYSAKPYRDCANEATDNADWAPIVACLLTAGYCEMWEFCDKVLGSEKPAVALHIVKN